MKYKATFWDRDFKILSQDQGEKLMDFIKEAKPTEPIFLEGEMYIRSQIVNIKRAIPGEDYDVESPTIMDPTRRIESKRCQGKGSVQFAIHEIIRNKYQTNWRTKIGDKKLRQELREALLATGKPYCDYKAGTCVCDSYTGYETANDKFKDTLDEVTRLMSA